MWRHVVLPYKRVFNDYIINCLTNNIDIPDEYLIKLTDLELNTVLCHLILYSKLSDSQIQILAKRTNDYLMPAVIYYLLSVRSSLDTFAKLYKKYPTNKYIRLIVASLNILIKIYPDLNWQPVYSFTLAKYQILIYYNVYVFNKKRELQLDLLENIMDPEQKVFLYCVQKKQTALAKICGNKKINNMILLNEAPSKYISCEQQEYLIATKVIKPVSEITEIKSKGIVKTKILIYNKYKCVPDIITDTTLTYVLNFLMLADRLKLYDIIKQKIISWLFMF